MKVLFLRTYTPDCEKFSSSCEAIGHSVHSIVYDDRPHNRQDEFVAMAKEYDPKVIVFIGAIERFHGRPVLLPAILKKLRDVAPTIHICSDGSERVWWENLVLYDQRGCFDAQVSIDGVTECPIARFRRGVVLLTPCDPRVFHVKPWEERARPAGITGTVQHGERAYIFSALRHRLGMPWREREGDYADMAAWLGDCQMTVNCPMNGSATRDHVKGRVIEAGWAQCCLLERKNEATAAWFQDDEICWYTDVEDCIQKIQHLRSNPEEAKAYAEKLRMKVATVHHPDRFWGKVFELAQMRDTVA